MPQFVKQGFQAQAEITSLAFIDKILTFTSEFSTQNLLLTMYLNPKLKL